MKLLFSTGEISGENYAIELKKVLEEKYENKIDFLAIGSSRMEDHGIRIIGDISPYSTIGFTDIVKNLPSLYSLVSKLKASMAKEKPDIVIFIDSPALNMRLIPQAKKIGAKSVYLFPPQVWAWGKKRLKTLKLLNKIIVSLPFEEEFYKKNNINTTFLGHPLIDMVKVDENYVNQIKEKYGENTRLIGTFPGSRLSEIRNHLPILGKTLENISNKFSDIVYLIASPSIEFSHLLENELKYYNFPYEIIDNHPYEVMQSSEFVLTSSGTATLEAAILGVPEIIFYRMNFVNWLFAKFLVKVDYIGLPNLVYGKLIIPELVQWDFNPYSLEYLMIKFIVDPKVVERMSAKLLNIKGMLGEGGVLERIGDNLLSIMV